jgi:hypothetical protein
MGRPAPISPLIRFGYDHSDPSQREMMLTSSLVVMSLTYIAALGYIMSGAGGADPPKELLLVLSGNDKAGS